MFCLEFGRLLDLWRNTPFFIGAFARSRAPPSTDRPPEESPLAHALCPTTPPQRVPYGPLARFLTHPNAWWHALGHDAAHLARAVLPVAAPIVGVLVALVVLAALVRLLARLRAPVGGHLVEVAMPPSAEAKAALGFWRNLHSVLSGASRLLAPPGQVAFEIESSAHGIELRFWVSSDVSAHAVARAVSSAWPGAQCQVRDSTAPSLGGPVTSCGELRLGAPAWLPLGTDQAVDPLRTVLRALPTWAETERAVVQVPVRPASRRSTRILARAARSLQTGPVGGRAALLAQQVDHLSPDDAPPGREGGRHLQ